MATSKNTSTKTKNTTFPAAATTLNAAAVKPKIALQAPPDRLNTEDADFIRGRDIAINMLAEAEALMGEREGLRWVREGKAQDNLVKGYLGDIIEDPKLIDGFTSILSMAIRNDHMDLDFLRKITLAETQAGAIGADGTQPGETPPVAAAPPVEQVDDAEQRRSLAFDANYEIQNLIPLVIDKAYDADDSGQLYPVIRGLMMRIDELNNLIHDAVISDVHENTPREIAWALGLASMDVHEAMFKEVAHG